MNAVERRREIVNCLNLKGNVQVSELAERFSTSEVTIRADLRQLEEKGLLVRYHGGANLPESHMATNSVPSETQIDERYQLAKDPKQRIAMRAAAMVKSGDSIILDSGSTTLCVANELAAMENITVITNNLPAAVTLSDNKDITLVLCGGTLRHKTRSLHGTLSENALQGITADLLFVGADGIDPVNGITTFNEGYAITGVMAKAAKKVVAVIDSSKFGRNGFNVILPTAELDVLITDTDAPEREREALEKAGVEVIVV